MSLATSAPSAQHAVVDNCPFGRLKQQQCDYLCDHLCARSGFIAKANMGSTWLYCVVITGLPSELGKWMQEALPQVVVGMVGIWCLLIRSGQTMARLSIVGVNVPPRIQLRIDMLAIVSKFA
jgi:hypothetical protein